MYIQYSWIRTSLSSWQNGLDGRNCYEVDQVSIRNEGTDFIFAIVSRLAVGSTQRRSQWVISSNEIIVNAKLRRMRNESLMALCNALSRYFHRWPKYNHDYFHNLTANF